MRHVEKSARSSRQAAAPSLLLYRTKPYIVDTSFPCAKSCLHGRCAECSCEFWASATHPRAPSHSGAPSQSLAGASFRAFEPKRGWQLRSALPAEDDFFSREAPSHRHRDGRLAQVTRQHLMSFRTRVRNHPIFCTLLTPFAALRAAVDSF